MSPEPARDRAARRTPILAAGAVLALVGVTTAAAVAVQRGGPDEGGGAGSATPAAWASWSGPAEAFGAPGPVEVVTLPVGDGDQVLVCYGPQPSIEVPRGCAGLSYAVTGLDPALVDSGFVRLSGTWDGTTLAVDDAEPADQPAYDEAPFPDCSGDLRPPTGPMVDEDFTTLLDPETNMYGAPYSTVVEGLDRYAWLVVTHEDPLGYGDDLAAQGATYGQWSNPWGLDVGLALGHLTAIERDAAVEAAVAEIRTVWRGYLCIDADGRYDSGEIGVAADEILAQGVPGASSVSWGTDRITLEVLYDDGRLQHWADQRWPGLVHVRAELRDVR
ncbi:hypothetical protein ACOACO_09285 [Nocardioides sp. CPCC 205120]|uniref:hypothetical protein n=1 Tax=Nocardioides sp. CPCC 205120 TaxID=3406462 RepID=UPI003B5095E3